MADGNQISARDIGLKNTALDEQDAFLNLRIARNNAERKTTVSAVGRVNGNVARAAELLEVSRPTLYDLMNRLNLK